MGLVVSVYRGPYGDCTLGGVSSKAARLCVVNVEGPFTPDFHKPAVLLESHAPGCVRIVPAVQDEDTARWVPAPGWHMAGGNYAATSDSRFSEAVEALTGAQFYGAVAIHDRREG